MGMGTTLTVEVSVVVLSVTEVAEIVT